MTFRRSFVALDHFLILELKHLLKHHLKNLSSKLIKLLIYLESTSKMLGQHRILSEITDAEVVQTLANQGAKLKQILVGLTADHLEVSQIQCLLQNDFEREKIRKQFQIDLKSENSPESLRLLHRIIMSILMQSYCKKALGYTETEALYAYSNEFKRQRVGIAIEDNDRKNKLRQMKTNQNTSLLSSARDYQDSISPRINDS